ncbi:MAG: NUDIX domain-containing protein [Candidatus Uhrbacteria bacterium]
MSYRKDKLEVVDQDGNVLRIEERGKIHKEGLLHRETHVWLYTPDGNLIFQRRAKNVDTFPELLDATVGGHVEVGDDYMETAIKEAKEEAGIDLRPEDLHFIKYITITTHDPVTGNCNNSIKAHYAFCYQGDISDLKVEEGKAYGFEAWSIDQILNPPESIKPQFIRGYFDQVYQDIFREIKLLSTTGA